MMADSTPEQTKPLVQVARSALARLCCTVGKEKVNPRWCSFSSPRRLYSNMKSLSLSAMKLNRFLPGPAINSSLTGCLAAFILTLVLLLSNSTKITLIRSFDKFNMKQNFILGLLLKTSVFQLLPFLIHN